MCHSWVRATCEGLKKDQYKQFTQLTNTITNIAYYCSLNQCASLNKKLIYDHLSSLKQNADIPTLRPLQTEQTNLHSVIYDVSNKLDELSTQNRNLQKQIEDVCFQITSPQNQITGTSETVAKLKLQHQNHQQLLLSALLMNLLIENGEKTILLFITFQSLLTILKTNHFLLSCVSLSLILLLK